MVIIKPIVNRRESTFHLYEVKVESRFSRKTHARLNDNMEEYRNTVIKLHAIYSMIISKSTSNISKNTSKFTSKTD